MKASSVLDLFPQRHKAGIMATYAQSINAFAVEGMGNFPALLLAIWQIRNQDLQHRYPLNSLSGRIGFLAWAAVSGGKEYQALRELDNFWEDLAKPAPVPFSEWSKGINRFLQLAIEHRSDLGIDSALLDAQSQAAALKWFWCNGGWKDFDPALLRISPWQAQFFLDHQDPIQTRFARLIYQHRPDLQKAFDIGTVEGQSGFRNWILKNGQEETGLPLLLQACNRKNYPDFFIPTPVLRSKRKQLSFGVNLIGYAFGELGIGEDVRMAAQACHAAGIPFCVIDFPPGKNIRKNDRSIESWVVDAPRYSINIFCLTALEHLRFFAERGGDICEGRYNIGYWPWELEYWPKNWEHCFNLVDEAWASSQHIAKAMRRVSPVPVHWMPMAVQLPVQLPEKANLDRAHFGLPTNKTLFVFSFDGSSFIERKNPQGVLDAFLHAFPNHDENVGLVIKCMRPDPSNALWQKIQAIAQHDKRLFIIEEMLGKTEVLKLYRACDVFVSLHRAEGFGRGIAEALLLGLDVITTDYSGNTDFCRPAGAYMVPYQLKPLSAHDYVEGDNNFWAEPDIYAAAQAMRRVAKLPRRVNLMLSCMLFAPLQIGARYKQRLSKIHTINKYTYQP